jgi:hypothetical protein
MRLIQQAGEEASLPEMAATSTPFVYVLRMTHVKPVESPGQGILPGVIRHHDEMHVVRHQAVRPDLQAGVRAAYPEPVKILPPVSIIVEHYLPVVPALRHVIGQSSNDNSRNSGHCSFHDTKSLRPVKSAALKDGAREVFSER